MTIKQNITSFVSVKTKIYFRFQKRYPLLTNPLYMHTLSAHLEIAKCSRRENVHNLTCDW